MLSRRSKSLPEVHASVTVALPGSFWRRLLSFSGPAFMVSVGYMDPGNWATDLAGGARFGYRLLWVILLSNLMAILLQSLAARMGVVSGRDLAQACRDHYPRPVTWILWILCEIAIAACDLAEVLGSAIGLYLLFGLPVLWGVVLTAADVMLFLILQSYGIRKLEAFILSLVVLIAGCFALQMALSRPPAGAVLSGLVPGYLTGDALYIAIGIIGATVMPHNLYLHSALVQSRAVERTPEGMRAANRYNLVDSCVALNGAFFVNAAILILAAATFHRAGMHEVASLGEAHRLLEGILGPLSPLAFAIALLAAGQSSTITGTLAGQIVMEGFVRIRLRPWLRRLVTRSLAVVPAVLVILWRGESAVDDLLVLSQVILSLQLSFAIVPLIHFTSDKRKMGDFALSRRLKTAAWIVAAIILSLNLKLVFETLLEGWRLGQPAVQLVLTPAVIVLVPLLAWMVLEPIGRQWAARYRPPVPVPSLPALETLLSRQYRKIGVALEVSHYDQDVLSGVLPLLRASKAEVVLIHVVESAAALYLGRMVLDEEARSDTRYLEGVAERLGRSGIPCRARVGAGEPEDEIARIAEEEQVDLIVVGSHGHHLLGDLFHGSTVSELRHQTTIPVLSIRSSPAGAGWQTHPVPG